MTLGASVSGFLKIIPSDHGSEIIPLRSCFQLLHVYLEVRFRSYNSLVLNLLSRCCPAEVPTILQSYWWSKDPSFFTSLSIVDSSAFFFLYGVIVYMQLWFLFACLWWLLTWISFHVFINHLQLSTQDFGLFLSQIANIIFFKDMASCSPGRPQIYYVAEDNLELLNPPPLLLNMLEFV